MKKNKKKQNKKNIISLEKIMFISIIGLSSIFIYRMLNLGDSSSGQVWCTNCQAYHDQATLNQEQQKQVWCDNCQTYHLPRVEESNPVQEQ